MQAGKPPSVWIDDRHAIVRRGMAACLQQSGFVVRGESGGLAPEPALAGLDVLVFEVEGASLRRAVRLITGSPTKLVATVREPSEQQVREIVDAGVGAVLPHDGLTPENNPVTSEIPRDWDAPAPLTGLTATATPRRADLPAVLVSPCFPSASNAAVLPAVRHRGLSQAWPTCSARKSSQVRWPVAWSSERLAPSR